MDSGQALLLEFGRELGGLTLEILDADLAGGEAAAFIGLVAGVSGLASPGRTGSPALRRSRYRR